MKEKASSVKEKALAAKAKAKAGKTDDDRATRQEKLLQNRVQAKGERLR